MTTDSEQTDGWIEPSSERVLRIADELEEAGVPRDRPAAALVSDLPWALRRAVINALNGEAWETVESRRHDDLCACDECSQTPTVASAQ